MAKRSGNCAFTTAPNLVISRILQPSHTTIEYPIYLTTYKSIPESMVAKALGGFLTNMKTSKVGSTV